METYAFLYLIALIIMLIPVILCIVLFFKVWGMTNDVEEIKRMLKVYLSKAYDNLTQ